MTLSASLDCLDRYHLSQCNVIYLVIFCPLYALQPYIRLKYQMRKKMKTKEKEILLKVRKCKGLTRQKKQKKAKNLEISSKNSKKTRPKAKKATTKL